jgi:hypothetical protein
MALERPEAGFVWLHVPRREGVEVVAISDIHTWWAHFVRVPGAKAAKAVRCLAADGRACEWCDAQVGRRARYVFAVRTGDVVRLVELGRVQFPLLQVMYEGGRWLGTRMELKREWDAANARIQIVPRGREVITDEVVVDIGDHVAGLGMAEARQLRPASAPDRSIPSKGPATPVEKAVGTRNAWSDRSK